MDHIMNSTESLHFHYLCISLPLKRHDVHSPKEAHSRCSLPDTERTSGVILRHKHMQAGGCMLFSNTPGSH